MASISACFSAKSSPVDLSCFKIIEATKNDTTAATNTPDNTARYDPLGVINRIAIIEPGDAAAFKPAPKSWNVNVPDTPPAIAAKINAGFIKMYGK